MHLIGLAPLLYVLLKYFKNPRPDKNLRLDFRRNYVVVVVVVAAVVVVVVVAAAVVVVFISQEGVSQVVEEVGSNLKIFCYKI